MKRETRRRGERSEGVRGLGKQGSRGAGKQGRKKTSGRGELRERSECVRVLEIEINFSIKPAHLPPHSLTPHPSLSASAPPHSSPLTWITFNLQLFVELLHFVNFVNLCSLS
ncbi:MAG: hypothetical protein BRC46_07395 [Cyanobacteria bacterium QS_6_48_18]|nr:MAG: hypothetical protein BRC46_07395 [Cyanobacteria bacterium QS_6_48_18]